MLISFQKILFLCTYVCIRACHNTNSVVGFWWWNCRWHFTLLLVRQLDCYKLLLPLLPLLSSKVLPGFLWSLWGLVHLCQARCYARTVTVQECFISASCIRERSCQLLIGLVQSNCDGYTDKCLNHSLSLSLSHTHMQHENILMCRIIFCLVRSLGCGNTT